jgi:hypothetical protein
MEHSLPPPRRSLQALPIWFEAFQRKGLTERLDGNGKGKLTRLHFGNPRLAQSTNCGSDGMSA